MVQSYLVSVEELASAHELVDDEVMSGFSTSRSRWKEVSKLTASGSATLGVLIWLMRWVLLVVVVGGRDYVVSADAVRENGGELTE